MSAGYGGGHGRSYAGGYHDQGDVHTHAIVNPTAIDALESAVALPGVFTHAELHRTLRRNRFDVMKAALQLREKHALRKQLHYDTLNIGLPALQVELKKGYVHILEDASDLQGCPVVLLLLQHFRPSFSRDVTQVQGSGAMDGSSSLEDTRRLCVYIMDLAVEAMEEHSASGVVFVVDLANCSARNLEAKLVTDVLELLQRWYPESVRHVLVINGTAVTRTLTHALARLAAEQTQQRIRVLSHLSELNSYLASASTPRMYGGTYQLLPPVEWIKRQAAIEQVDLESTTATGSASTDALYRTKDARALNGMQYAACSVADVAAMATSAIRGPIVRRKTDAVWVKLYGLLRPEALLLYEHANAQRPQLIVPMTFETIVAIATFADAPRGTFGVRVDVPGVIGGHLLAVGSETERSTWLVAMQTAIRASADELAREQQEDERRTREAQAFAALNMISFDDPAPVQAPVQAAVQQAVQQVQSPLQTPSPMYQQQQHQPLGATATAGYVVAPSLVQQQQSNMVNPLGMNMSQQQQQYQQQYQQYQQQLVRPPQPVHMPMMGQHHPQQQHMGGQMPMGMPMMPMQQQAPTGHMMMPMPMAPNGSGVPTQPMTPFAMQQMRQQQFYGNSNSSNGQWPQYRG